MSPVKEQYDLDKDGKITTEELNSVNELHELEIKNRKLESQKQMAWVALTLIAVVTFFLFTPVITDGRVNALSDLLSMFYIACAGIVGAYVGVTAWMSRK